MFRISQERATKSLGKDICLKLNSASFGYATNTLWEFFITYDGDSHWNFEKPKLPTYYETPRSVLKEVSDPDSPTVGAGRKVPWDYLCPHIEKGVSYMHPTGHRLLTQHELELLHGGPLDKIPPAIEDYLNQHIVYFESGAWGDKCFDAYYDRHRRVWVVNHNLQELSYRRFNMSEYIPTFCHPASDRYPGARK